MNDEGDAMTPEEIRWTRAVFHFSRAEMSRVMSVSYNSVRRWEKGEDPPTGLHLGVLRALHTAALDVEGDEPRRLALSKLLTTGVGGIVADVLLSWGRGSPPRGGGCCPYAHPCYCHDPDCKEHGKAVRRRGTPPYKDQP